MSTLMTSQNASPLRVDYWNAEELRSFGFASVGHNSKMAKNCAVYGEGNIHLGNDVRIDSFCTIVAVRGKVRLGNNIHVGSYCHINAADAFVMEDFAGISQGTKIITASDDFSGDWMTGPTLPPEYTNVHSAPITLGRHVVIGAGTVVLPGCSVGEGSTVGALSVITKPLDPWGIYVGAPARRLKDRSRKLLEREARLIASRRES